MDHIWHLFEGNIKTEISLRVIRQMPYCSWYNLWAKVNSETMEGFVTDKGGRASYSKP